MQKILAFFDGKKTYITGILMILLGLLTDDKGMILEGIGFITIRASISKK